MPSSGLYGSPHSHQVDETDSDENEEDLLKTLSSHLLSPTDILPLVMNDTGVSLDPQPSQSTLPISPIFISHKRGLQDIMPADLASVMATMENEVHDLDALLAEVTKPSVVESNKENANSVRILKFVICYIGRVKEPHLFPQVLTNTLTIL